MAETERTEPRRRRPPRGRGVRERADSEHDLREFDEEIKTRIRFFLQSSEAELELEPMNSYRRRAVHKLCKTYPLDSESRGEGRERYVCLIRTPDTPHVPPAEFSPPTFEDPPVLEAQTPSTPSRTPTLDFGTRTFFVNPGKQGLRMALKMDGTVELSRPGEERYTLHERIVTTRQIRIRQGKIVQPEDPEW